MPMSIEAVCAYLGTVLAGCCVVGIADSFAPSQMQARMRISDAAAIVTQDVILRGSKTLPMYARVVAAQAPRAIVIPAQPDKGLQVWVLPCDSGTHGYDIIIVDVVGLPQHSCMVGQVKD